MTMPNEAYEHRTADLFREGDHVWDPVLGRWKRVTSVERYRAVVSRRPMLKITMDLSTYHRPVGHDHPYMIRLDSRP